MNHAPGAGSIAQPINQQKYATTVPRTSPGMYNVDGHLKECHNVSMIDSGYIGKVSTVYLLAA